MHTDTQTGMSSTDEVRQKATETASTVIDQAQQIATSQITSQKERVASTLDSVAHSIHATGSTMEDQQPQMAQLAHEAADRVATVSDYVRQHDLNDLVTEVESFAR